MLKLVAIDANRIGCVVAVPLPEITRLRPREVRAYSQLAAHLATGHRLRADLSQQPVPRAPEAILRLDGTLEHATHTTKPARAQEALRRLAFGIDRARSDLRRDDPERALEIWTAMVSGRWTLVDQFHGVGKRFLIARRNDPRIAEPASLTLRERQIASYAALGHSNKLIAYELGIAASTVATHLTSAQTKLGVKNRVELIRVLMGAAETGGSQAADANVGPSSNGLGHARHVKAIGKQCRDAHHAAPRGTRTVLRVISRQLASIFAGDSLKRKLFAGWVTAPFSIRNTPSRVRPVTMSSRGSSQRMYQKRVTSKPRLTLLTRSSTLGASPP